jgi:hypothetical protein
MTLLSTGPKKPGAAFWATVVVAVLLIAYPLSMGPACWIVNQEWCPSAGQDAYPFVYLPIYVLYFNGPQPVQGAIEWYGELWVSPD